MRRLALALVLLLLVARPAAAQLTGVINGTVTDEQGAVLPGARVTASSPDLITPQVALTNSLGVYRFPAVPPGTYSLKIELTGFKTLERKDIIVGLGFTATIDVKLPVATLAETVTVTGESPVVDLETPKAQSNFTLQQLRDLPNARDIWSAMGMSPGMMVTSFDVGGSRAGTQTGFSAFGYSGQVRVQVDGVNTTEGTGAAGFYYDYGSFQEIQLSSGVAGGDASQSTPGLQLNAILRQGGNRFSGEVYSDYEDKLWQGQNVDDELKRKGVNIGTRILLYRDPNASLGGPIKRDKAWFFASVRDQRTGVTVDNFPVEQPRPFFFETRLTNVSYKLTYALSQNHRLGHYIQWGRKYQPHRGASSTTYSDAPFMQDSWSWAANVDLNSVITSRFFFNTRYAQFGYDWPNKAYGVGGIQGVDIRQRRSEQTTGNTAGGTNPDQNDRKRHQFDWTGTYFKDNFLKGNHAFKFGWLTEWEMQEFTDHGFLDHVSLTFRSANGAPDFTTPFRVTLRNTPNFSRDETLHHAAYLNDQWKLSPKLTFDVGVRWEYYTSNYPDQIIPDGPFRGFFYDGAPIGPNNIVHPSGPSLYAGQPVIPGQSDIRTVSSVAPRFGMAWNLDGRRTVIKANWGRFYFNTGLAGSAVNPSATVTAVFNWADPDGNKTFTMNELGTLVSANQVGGATLAANLKHGYTDTTSVWLERELVKDVGVRIGYTYATDGNLTAAIQQNRLASLYTVETRVPDPGPDGLTGTDDDREPFSVWDIPSPVPASRTITENVNSLLVIDRSFNLTFTKRYSRKWSALVDFLYNWDRDRGLVQNPNQERFNDNTVTNWAVKVNGTYEAPWQIVISPSIRYQAGDPLARIVQATAGIDAATGLPRNLNLTLNYQADRQGDWREDNITLFDMRFEKRFDLRGRQTLGLFFDAFNITNSNESQGADDTVGRRTVTLASGEVVNYQRFLRPTSVLSPRIYRIGFRFTF